MNRNDEILKVALELQERDTALKERDRDLDEKARAASEVGLDPSWIAKATEIVDTRLAVPKLEARKPGRTWMLVAALAAAGGIAAVATAVLVPWSEPPAPWRYDFEGAPTFVLDKNPETIATVGSVTLPSHGAVAVLHVEKFVPSSNGDWQANVTVTDVPQDLSQWQEVGVQLRGDLPIARLYLDNGAERWRSGPIPVGSDWSPTWLKFRAMDHQVRKDGKWQTVDWVAPKQISAISIKTGTFMNDEHATGDVMIDNIELR